MNPLQKRSRQLARTLLTAGLPCALVFMAGCQHLPMQGAPAPVSAPPQAPTVAATAATLATATNAITSSTTANPATAEPVSAPLSQPDVLAHSGQALQGPTAQAPVVPADLWARLRAGMAMPALEYELVQQHATRFASTAFFERRADRIRLYLPLIVEEIEQRNMPLELAMLPLVESALNPHARSSVGALGFWQFMQPTAHRFELRTSRLVDDRKNLREATRAALDYLGKLHAQFGEWHLAMAAYNWGEGRVQRLVTRQRGLGAATDFASLAPLMPAETRNYVPQIMALARLVATPASFAHTLPDMPDHNPLVEVELAQDTDLQLALRFSGLQQAEFLRYNPAAKPPLLLAAATPRLLMPETAARSFEAAQAAHSGRTASYRLVKLATTQHLDAIAQSHGTHAAGLRAANGIPAGMKPVQGSVLLVPGVAPAGSKALEDLVATAKLEVTQDVIKLTAHARSGETGLGLAQRCGVSPDDLARWNNWSAKKLRSKVPPQARLAMWVPRETPGPCAQAAGAVAQARQAPPVPRAPSAAAAKPRRPATTQASAPVARSRNLARAPDTTPRSGGKAASRTRRPA